MAVYSGIVDSELEEDFKHRVTWTPKASTDKWGKPVAAEAITGIPAFWIGKSQIVQAVPLQYAIAQYVKVLLPHDVLPAIGDKLKNEATNVELEIKAVTPPIYADDTSIPCSVVLQ
jgi:hypothetical protein